ncbi:MULTISPECIES: hypothetical protein [unclassified Neisseria]|uniref:hypothetical protein n=1 Tax=unclassified Neisseria TaxID=2623750 RepID=UPI002665A8BF|nr:MULTISPECIES: hypothetical protein [unclassified Neisseria]MDO1509790.1 hypothetical protein [Neisseria sp. MVDL19-042950]MDO1515886.1 hypothetical protein [Neisseria sp. MVDL18-041461]MDO1562999.1 hypothetical protein [Neisseria sp. MVDL20-010259]
MALIYVAAIIICAISAHWLAGKIINNNSYTIRTILTMFLFFIFSAFFRAGATPVLEKILHSSPKNSLLEISVFQAFDTTLLTEFPDFMDD